MSLYLTNSINWYLQSEGTYLIIAAVPKVTSKDTFFPSYGVHLNTLELRKTYNNCCSNSVHFLQTIPWLTFHITVSEVMLILKTCCIICCSFYFLAHLHNFRSSTRALLIKISRLLVRRMLGCVVCSGVPIGTATFYKVLRYSQACLSTRLFSS